MSVFIQLNITMGGGEGTLSLFPILFCSSFEKVLEGLVEVIFIILLWSLFFFIVLLIIFVILLIIVITILNAFPDSDFIFFGKDAVAMDYVIHKLFALFAILFIHLDGPLVEGAEVVDYMEWELDVHPFHQVGKAFAIGKHDALYLGSRSNDIDSSLDETGSINNGYQVINT